MTESGGAPPRVEEVDPERAAGLLAGGALLLDVRELEEWSAGHAPDATHLPLSELVARLSEVPTEHSIVTICRSGHRSLVAAAALNSSGRVAYSLAGGMLAWADAGCAVVDGSGDSGSVV